MITAIKIEAYINTGAKHVLYRKDGKWYHHLKSFPGALFDEHGYLTIPTQSEYKRNKAFQHGDALHVTNGIASIKGYKTFTNIQLKKIKAFENNTSKQRYDHEADWQRLLSNAQKQKKSNRTFYSPVHKKNYYIKSVTENSIIVKREKGKDSIIEKRFVINRLSEIRRARGKISKRLISGHVAQISTLVYLHPDLHWSDDLLSIIIRTPSQEKMLRIAKADIDSLKNENSNSFEGGSKKRLVSYYERKPHLRAKAIKIHGLACKVCGFDFEEHYGPHGKDFIEVHHKKPVHTLKLSTRINPENDMDVLCSNCHRMIHRKKYKPLTIEELIRLRKKSKKGQ